MLFAKRTEGASGIEYALIAGMVAVALVAFVPTISAAVTAMFTQIEGAL
ncbi:MULTISPECIES: Flp family type IVb pilin [Pseudomonas]|nr:Flp family type IVb pilin [Pseudomonas sp. D1HM]